MRQYCTGVASAPVPLPDFYVEKNIQVSSLNKRNWEMKLKKGEGGFINKGKKLTLTQAAS